MVDKKTVAIAILVIISALGWGMYLKADSEVKSLNYLLGIIDESLINLHIEYSNLEVEKTEIEIDYSALKSKYDSIKVKIFDALEEVGLLQLAERLSMTKLTNAFSLYQASYHNLKEDYDELESAYETLNYSYSALQETYELYKVNLYKEIPFNITRQEVGYIERYFDFDIGYGIICTTWIKVKTETSGVQIGAGSSWTRGGESGYMGSSGRTYTQLESKLTGYAYCRIFDSDGQIQVEIGVRPRNQTSWHGRDCFGTFPKILS